MSIAVTLPKFGGSLPKSMPLPMVWTSWLAEVIQEYSVALFKPAGSWKSKSI